MDVQEITNSMGEGNRTVAELADDLDEDTQDVQIVLDTLENIGVAEKQNPTDTEEASYVITSFSVPDSIELSDEFESSAEELARTMPVNREYNWERYKPSGIQEYKEHSDEMQRVRAEINRRYDDNAREPVFWFTGPTGCGKTLAAQNIAAELDAVFITIQCKYSMNESAIVGSPMLVGDQTIWSDGPAVKALLASQDHPVVLLLDEANRARPEAKEALYSMLDDRSEITIERRGGEQIVGDPDNLIVIATTNEGDGHITQKIDDAEKRRFGNKIPFEFLGWEEDPEESTEHRDKAAELVSSESGAPLELSRELVDVSNEIRQQAREEGNTIKVGVPTSKIIDWAKTAYSYGVAGIDNPIVKAGEASVLNPFYDGDELAKDEVQTIISSAFEEAPIDEESYEQWSERDMNDFVQE